MTLRQEMRDLRQEVRDTRTELKADLADMKGDLREVRIRMDHLIDAIATLGQRLSEHIANGGHLHEDEP